MCLATPNLHMDAQSDLNEPLISLPGSGFPARSAAGELCNARSLQYFFGLALARFNLGSRRDEDAARWLGPLKLIQDIGPAQH
jgi:hypothetical protein